MLESGTLENGAEERVGFHVAQDVCYTLTLTSGDYDSEISWNFDGVLSGGAPFATGFYMQSGVIHEGCNVPSQTPTLSQHPTTPDPTAAPTMSTAPTVQPRFAVLAGGCTAHGFCVSSPNFPDSYGHDQVCVVLANMDGVLNASHFDIQYDAINCAGCGCDSLTMKDDTKYCGTDGPVGVSAKAGDSLVFVSDDDTDASGFEICMMASYPTASPTTPVPTTVPVPSPTVSPTVSVAPTNAFEVGFFMVDSYGDGWNGAVATITEPAGNSTVVVKTTTLSDGASGTTKFPLASGVCYTLTISSGDYPGEISWTMGFDGEIAGNAPSTTEFILGGDGNVHYGCSAPSSGAVDDVLETPCVRVFVRVAYLRRELN